MISAIILAAGSSSRMPQKNKLLLPIHSQTLVRHVVQIYCQSDLSELIIVVGNDWKSIVKELRDLPVTYIYNPAYQLGMMSSIKSGLKILSPTQDFMIATADTPGITAKHINSTLEIYQNRTNNKAIIRSHSPEGFSHPTIFTKAYREVLLNCQEMDGARDAIGEFKDDWIPVESYPQVLFDIDSPDEYVNWKTCHNG